jgi:SNF2 family DNA or RNA helicase
VSSKHIRQLKADKKLCLSGTPIQNDPSDLCSLVQWIYKDEDPDALNKLNMSSKSKATRMRCTEVIRNSMLMRRTMDDVSVFNPSLTLPDLDVKVVSIPFASPDEALLYQHVEDIAKERIQNVLKQYNTQGNMDILEALLRCRQVCIHPRLFVDAVNEQPTVAHKWKVPMHILSNALPSTKLNALVNMIAAHPLDKSLVFSTFVKEMKTLQKMLAGRGINSMLYHGDMTGDEREHVLDTFKTTNGPNSVKVLIIQMNAGGTGLNLQVANRCYVTSPAYNPSLELQCIARAHRTGQTKDVTCVRLVMQDTVEERILDIQKKKLDMISHALDDERITQKLAKDRIHMTSEDILALFDIHDLGLDMGQPVEIVEESPICNNFIAPPLKKSKKISKIPSCPYQEFMASCPSLFANKANAIDELALFDDLAT